MEPAPVIVSVDERAANEHRILVCVDRLAVLRRVPALRDLARRSPGSEITLLHVMQPARQSQALHTDVLDWEISRQEARAYLERLERDGARRPGTPSGPARARPPRRAHRRPGAEIDADLTVIGSQGEGGVTAWNLGSTAQQVLAVARGRCSSRRRRAREVARRRQHPRPARWFPPQPRASCPPRSRIAGANGAELLLAYVVREPCRDAVLRAPEDIDFARELAAVWRSAPRRTSTACASARARGTSVRTVVARHARRASVAPRASGHEQADLIVVSAHGMPPATRRGHRERHRAPAHPLGRSAAGPPRPARRRAAYARARRERPRHALRASYPPRVRDGAAETAARDTAKTIALEAKRARALA